MKIAREKVWARFINRENLKPDTTDFVSIKFLDQMVSFCQATDTGYQGITWQDLKENEISSKEIYEILEENIKNNAIINTLPNMLKGMISTPVPEDDTANSMIVITNKMGIFGAIGILSAEVLSEVSKLLDTKKFIILPSSIHEVICIPKGDIEKLKGIVAEINSSIVLEEEFLSNNIYICEISEEKTTIATSEIFEKFDKSNKNRQYKFLLEYVEEI